jgi:biopolymer transport protein ExbD
MAATSSIDDTALDSEPLLKQRRMPDDAEIDMTPMIDCVFLLNIFFILTYIPDPASAVNPPPSSTGVAIDPRRAVVVTIAEGPTGAAVVYLGEDKKGAPLPDDENSQREALLQYLQAGASEGKTYYLIKADRAVKGGDLSRVVGVVSEVEGLTPHFAVMETPD